MGFWKKIFGPLHNTKDAVQNPSIEVERSTSLSANRKDSHLSEGYVGNEKGGMFVSLIADGVSYRLLRYEVGCGFEGCSPYDVPDILCDNAMIMVFENVKNENVLLNWFFKDDNHRGGEVLWHENETRCHPFLFAVTFRKSKRINYTKKFDAARESETIEIRIHPEVMEICGLSLEKKCKI